MIKRSMTISAAEKRTVKWEIMKRQYGKEQWFIKAAKRETKKERGNISRPVFFCPKFNNKFFYAKHYLFIHSIVVFENCSKKCKT